MGGGGAGCRWTLWPTDLLIFLPVCLFTVMLEKCPVTSASPRVFSPPHPPKSRPSGSDGGARRDPLRGRVVPRRWAALPSPSPLPRPARAPAEPAEGGWEPPRGVGFPLAHHPSSRRRPRRCPNFFPRAGPAPAPRSLRASPPTPPPRPRPYPQKKARAPRGAPLCPQPGSPAFPAPEAPARTQPRKQRAWGAFPFF